MLYIMNFLKCTLSLCRIWTRSYIHEDMRVATLCSRMYLRLKRFPSGIAGLEGGLIEQCKNEEILKRQFPGEYKLDQHSMHRFVAGDKPFKFTTDKMLLEIEKKWVNSMELDRIYKLDMKRVRELETEYLDDYSSVVVKWTLEWMSAKCLVVVSAIIMYGVLFEWNNELYGATTIVFLVVSTMALLKMSNNFKNEWSVYVEALSENFENDVCKTSSELQAQKERRELIKEVAAEGMSQGKVMAL